MTSMIKMLIESSNRIEKNLIQLTKQYEHQNKRNALDRKCLHVIIDSLISMAKWTQSTKSEKDKMKPNINKTIDELQSWQQQLNTDEDTLKITNEPSQPPIINKNNTTTTNDNVINNQNKGQMSLEEDPKLDPTS